MMIVKLQLSTRIISLQQLIEFFELVKGPIKGFRFRDW